MSTKNKIFFSFFFSLFSMCVFAQNTIVDSLLKVIQSSTSDTATIHAYHNLFLEYEFVDVEKARESLTRAMELSKKKNLKKEIAVTYNYFGFLSEDEGDFTEALNNYLLALEAAKVVDDKDIIATAYNNIGLVYGTQSNYTEALKYHKASLELVESIGDKMSAASSYINIALIYDALGNYPEALKYHFISLKIKEEINDKSGIATSYNGIGNIYHNQNKYPEALQYYTNSLKIAESIKDEQTIAEAHNNIGIVYIAKLNYQEALKHYLLALEIKEKIGDYKGTASTYANIGEIYYFQNEFQQALDNYATSLKIYEKIGKKEGVALMNANMGQILIKQKKYAEAEKKIIMARDLSMTIGHKGNLCFAYLCYANLDSALGNYKRAFENYKNYILYRDSIDNEESRKKIVQAQMTYDFEKKEAVAKAEHKKELENQKALAEEKSKKQKVVIVLVIFGLILVLVFSGYILRSLRITRKQKQMIETQKDEIEAQRDMVTQQKEYIEEIHKEVTDSIQYAKRIQTAVLPNNEYIKERIRNDFFILFKPKDIVSGDFYFIEKRKNMLFVAVADCTGHGVPGAFMSMLGISFLNEIIAIEEIQTAGQVLDEAREYIIRSLQQKGISGEQKDGMDIGFCAINTETLEMQFAGANNPCWVVSQFGNEKEKGMDGSEQLGNFQIFKFSNLVELKPDKQPIGIHTNMQPFTNQNYQLQKGDIIYLMSDGFEDQFGGPNRKKFLAKNLKNLLKANSQWPMADQKHILETTINEWIGTGEQIDDITLLGIKI